MTTITEALELPDGVSPSSVRVELELWGDGAAVTGFESAGVTSIAGTARATGTPWSITNVIGNSDIDAPTGSVYKVTRTWPGLRKPLVDYLDVPASGSHAVGQILTDPPATIETAAVALKVAKAGDTMTGGLTLSAGADLTVTGDATINGEIKTGTFGSPATFTGIEREGRVFPAGQMVSPTAAMNFGDGFPRLNMPPSVTTDAYMIFEVEEWWLDSTIGVYFEWVNDHTTTGDVRFDCSIKECDIATQTLASAGTMASRVFTEPAPGANVSLTSIVCGTIIAAPASFNPGPIASFYVLKISRIGANAADTLAGPIGLIAASMTRGQ